jgi:hypothetical protein
MKVAWGLATAAFTVSVKLWLAVVPTPLLAINVNGYVVLVPAAGVPLSTPVPWLKVTPIGNAPLEVIDGAGG